MSNTPQSVTSGNKKTTHFTGAQLTQVLIALEHRIQELGVRLSHANDEEKAYDQDCLTLTEQALTIVKQAVKS